jgi:hypothetical protein
MDTWTSASGIGCNNVFNWCSTNSFLDNPTYTWLPLNLSGNQPLAAKFSASNLELFEDSPNKMKTTICEVHQCVNKPINDLPTIDFEIQFFL